MQEAGRSHPASSPSPTSELGSKMKIKEVTERLKEHLITIKADLSEMERIADNLTNKLAKLQAGEPQFHREVKCVPPDPNECVQPDLNLRGGYSVILLHKDSATEVVPGKWRFWIDAARFAEVQVKKKLATGFRVFDEEFHSVKRNGG